MSEFAVETVINASPERVWATLSDIGTISEWNPGVQASHTTSEQAKGIGACRHCNLGSAGYLDEEVVTWQENEATTFRIVGTNMPFASADIRFLLDPHPNGTQVTCSPIYKLKFGPIGQLLDTVMVKRTYRGGMESLLAGLKSHIEASQ